MNGIQTKKKQTYKNIQKHNITFEQASYVFADPFSLSRFDDKHSDSEDRWVILGKSLNETILLVVHTYKMNGIIESVRIISARKATKQEKTTYQKRCPH